VANFFGTHRTTIQRDGRGWQWLQPALIIPPPPAVPPVAQYLFTRQQQPGHPLPFVFPGVRPQIGVAPSVRNAVMVRQEQPRHPQPQFWRGVQPANPVAARFPDIKIFVRQEFPLAERTPTPMVSNSSPYNSPWVFAYTVQ